MNKRLPGLLKSNGQEVQNASIEDGYILMKRRWLNDEITFGMEMPVEMMMANLNVGSHKKMVALQRGALVYGFEKIDNPLFEFSIDKNTEWKIDHDSEMFDGIVPIKAKINDLDSGEIKAIPFYALANRELSCQKVWINYKDSLGVYGNEKELYTQKTKG